MACQWLAIVIIYNRADAQGEKVMKILINLKHTNEAEDFIKNLDHRELKDNLDFYYPAKYDLTIKSEDIYVSFIGSNLWIENEYFILLRVPLYLVHDFVIKEGK